VLEVAVEIELREKGKRGNESYWSSGERRGRAEEVARRLTGWFRWFRAVQRK